MRELPAEDAATFDADGGRAFGLPHYTQSQVVVERPGVGCSVVARHLDDAKLIAAADTYFGAGSPFNLLDEQPGPAGGTRRVYGAHMGGPLTLYLNTEPATQALGAQAKITIVRRPSTDAQ